MEPNAPNLPNNPSSIPNEPHEIYCSRCGSPVRGRFCSICGFPTASQTPSVPSAPLIFVPPAPSAVKSKGHTASIIVSIAAGAAVLILLFIMLLRFSLSSYSTLPLEASSEMNAAREGVSSEEYQKLSVGMYYAQARASIGGDGNLVDSGENAYGKTYYIYGWPGERNESAAVYLTFIDDAISEISVDGTL